MKLVDVERNNAPFIRNTIKKRLESENYYVPNNAILMQEVVKYPNIDIPYLEAREILWRRHKDMKDFEELKESTKKYIIIDELMRSKGVYLLVS